MAHRPWKEGERVRRKEREREREIERERAVLGNNVRETTSRKQCPERGSWLGSLAGFAGFEVVYEVHVLTP